MSDFKACLSSRACCKEEIVWYTLTYPLVKEWDRNRSAFSTPGFLLCIYSILETETHALSLHTQGEVCRLENSATSSTTPQGLDSICPLQWQLLCNIFLVACANVSFLMLVSLCKHLKRRRQGLGRIAYLTSLSKSYSVTLSTDSFIPSTAFPSESY